MKRVIFMVTLLVLLSAAGCASGGDEEMTGPAATSTVPTNSTAAAATASPATTTATIAVTTGTSTTTTETPGGEMEFDYRQAMRDLVEAISAYAKGVRPGFIIIPQNGHDLLLDEGAPAEAYLEAIDGVGREDLFYGYDSDDVATPPDVRADILPYLDTARAHGVAVLVTDYCATPSRMDDSYRQNALKDYLSFAADRRDLDDIPGYPSEPYGSNPDDVTSLGEAANFLYLISPEEFEDKEAFIAAVGETEYDVLIIDAFFDGEPLAAGDVARLQRKAGGGRRLVIAYLSIGEAESYRYYWQSAWESSAPAWLAGENPDWPGNFKVRYWDPEWQAVIYGGAGAYLDRLLAAGFDGTYLDIIDAFEYFEE